MGTIPASENEFPLLRLLEVAAPSTPASGLGLLYFKSDGKLYSKNDAGAEVEYAAASTVVADLAAHLADTGDAHDASAVSVLDTAAVFTATDVEAALKELYDSIAGAGSVATDVIWDAAGDIAVGSGANTAVKLSIGASDDMTVARVSGAVAWAYPKPRAKGCSVSGVSTALTQNAYTSLAFGSTDTYDSDAYHDPASNNTRMTVPSGLGGVYSLTVQTTYPSSGSANTDRRLAWRVNGGADNPFWNDTRSVSSTTLFYFGAVQLVLAAGDYVEIRQYTGIASTTTVTYAAQLFLQGY